MFLQSLISKWTYFVLFTALFNLQQVKAQDVYCAKVDFKMEEKENGNVEFIGFCDKPVSEWYWYFGDSKTSREQNPSHQYELASDYEVCLKVLVNDHCTGAICKKISVENAALSVPCNLKVDFNFETDQLTLTAKGFFNSTSITNTSRFNWDFGDQSKSEGQEVRHQYANKGEYNVCLTVTLPNSTATGSICTETVCKKIKIGDNTGSSCQIHADFKYELIELNFNAKGWSDLGPHATYYWKISNGITVSGQVLNYTFPGKGDYEVCLVVAKPATTVSQSCTEVVCKKVKVGENISSGCGLSADFKFELTGNNLLAKAWTNVTSGIKYYWKISDGISLEGQEIKHTFANRGEYEVCLVAIKAATNTSSICTEIICKKIKVGETNSSDCVLNVDFKFELTGSNVRAKGWSDAGNGAKYTWKISDGKTYDGQELQHDFVARGEYSVCLTVTKPAISVTQICTETICKKLVVGSNNIADCDLGADFKYIKSANGFYSFFGRSKDPNATYQWTISDLNQTWDAKDFRTQLTRPGVYTVCLTVTSIEKACREKICKRLIVGRSMRLYPNPSEDMLFVVGDQSISQYFILNRGNQIIQSGTGLQNEVSIDILNLPTGMYFLTLVYDDGSRSMETFFKR